MIAALVRRLRTVAFAGFPWIVPTATSPGDVLKVRRTARRNLFAHWPTAARWLAIPLSICLWPFMSLWLSYRVAAATLATAREGQSQRTLCLAAWWAALRHNARPDEFVAWGMHKPGALSPGHWLYSIEAAVLCRMLTGERVRALCQDKRAFAAFCAAHELTCPPELMDWQTDPAALVGIDLVAKPRHGTRGGGIEIWLWRETVHHRPADPLAGTPAGDLTTEDLCRRLRNMDARLSGGLITQRLLDAHPSLYALATQGPPVARIVTQLLPEPKVVSALLQRPKTGRWLSHGGAFRSVDPDTGQVVPRCPLAPPFPGLEDDPAFDGVTLPDWTPLAARVLAAHGALPGPAPLLGWDVVFTADGPVVLEANVTLSPYFWHVATQRPDPGWVAAFAAYL